MEAKLKSKDKEEAVEDEEDLKGKQEDLNRTEKDIVKLGDFLQLLNLTWSDTYQSLGAVRGHHRVS